ncbi:MAG: oligoendopeptidase F [Clostridia bacterium]|nr:oligoendopeptidase F [Clostridia bacterium]
MDKLLERSQIDDNYKWNLEAIYSDDSIWEQDYKEVESLGNEFVKYEGNLSESGETLLSAIRLSEKVNRKLERMYVYAHMRRDENNGNSVYQDMLMRVDFLASNISAQMSFFEPEMLAIPEETLRGYVEDVPGMELYRFAVEEQLRQKEHVLSEKEERLLALAGEALGTPDEVFKMFNDADIRFPVIKDPDGNKTELTKGRFSVFMDCTDRNVRKNAFKSLYKSYSNYKNTLAACYAGSVKGDCFYAKARRFKSSLEAALDSDNVSAEIYDNLIESIHSSLPAFHEYFKIRKKALGVSKLHLYDMYVPLVEIPEKKYSFEEAKQMVLNAVKPLGEDYCRVIEEAYNSGWIDVYENAGKTSGAYSWGCFDSHPYVLLNWQGTVDDVFTLAHELGHAMHSYYSNKTQPYTYAGYKIFVAEVASTVNENLLIKYLLASSNDKTEKAYLINHYLESIRLTIVRQVMFAEFEKKVHDMCEAGEALTCDMLCRVYYELNKEYFGKNVVIDEEIAMEWARIPHFYSSFYVYKYAIGFSAAVKLSDNILSGDETLLRRYIEFLKSGGSNYPTELLKNAGVDLYTSDAVASAMKLFSDMLEEFKICLFE